MTIDITDWLLSGYNTLCYITFMFSLNRLWLMDGWMDWCFSLVLYCCRTQKKEPMCCVSMCFICAMPFKCVIQASEFEMLRHYLCIAYSMPSNSWFDLAVIVLEPDNDNDDIKSPLTMDNLIFRDPCWNDTEKKGKTKHPVHHPQKVWYSCWFLPVIIRVFFALVFKSIKEKKSYTHTYTQHELVNIDHIHVCLNVFRNYEIHVIN